MKLAKLCPELQEIREQKTTEDPITEVIYGREDRRYKVVYKSGYTHVTADPEDDIIDFIKDGNITYQKRLYASRRRYE